MGRRELLGETEAQILGGNEVKILYVAKHNSGGADDEGAIAYALEVLGHKVTKVGEREAGTQPLKHLAAEHDFLLFHKWENHDLIKSLVSEIPLVFWYFDLVDHPDPTLAGRCFQRRLWMQIVSPLIKVGFCTDGDWVNKNTDHNTWTPYLVWLPQGADERVIGKEESLPIGDLLFTGISKGGTGRKSFVEFMVQNYGDRFRHISQGFYRRNLAKLISHYRITVAPDSPVTNNYWSNRVYNSLGFGACLVHPYCERLYDQYRAGKDLIFYTNREDLKDKIEIILRDFKLQEELSTNGLAATKNHHTYRHRCEVLIQEVKNRL